MDLPFPSAKPVPLRFSSSVADRLADLDAATYDRFVRALRLAEILLGAAHSCHWGTARIVPLVEGFLLAIRFDRVAERFYVFDFVDFDDDPRPPSTTYRSSDFIGFLEQILSGMACPDDPIIVEFIDCDEDLLGRFVLPISIGSDRRHEKVADFGICFDRLIHSAARRRFEETIGLLDGNRFFGKLPLAYDDMAKSDLFKCDASEGHCPAPSLSDRVTIHLKGHPHEHSKIRSSVANVQWSADRLLHNGWSPAFSRYLAGDLWR